jgi:hypothetical protein
MTHCNQLFFDYGLSAITMNGNGLTDFAQRATPPRGVVLGVKRD